MSSDDLAEASHDDQLIIMLKLARPFVARVQKDIKGESHG